MNPNSEGQDPQGTAEDNGEGQGSVEETDYSLASGFLEKVPEEERPIVEKYVKQWDAGVTRRFQDLHKQYEPYKQLGDVESLQRAAYLANLVDTDPHRVYEALGESLGLTKKEAKALADQMEEEEPGALPKEYLDRFNKYEQTLQNLAQYVLNQHQQTQAQQEDAELDQYLSLLKDEFGDFDEEYVLTKMYNGASGEDAVRAYQSLIQSQINAKAQAGGNGAPQQQLPTLSSSGGSGYVPEGQQSVTSLSRNETKKLVANVLQNLAAQEQ